MLRMSGVPPRGPRSTHGFPPLAKPVTGRRPLGSRSLTQGAFPLPPPRGRTEIFTNRRAVPPNFAERKARKRALAAVRVEKAISAFLVRAVARSPVASQPERKT